MSLEGRLDDLSLADIFQMISLSKRSGVLTVIRKEGTGRLVFSMGQLVHASSDSKSRLGYRLVKNGTVKNETLEEALRVQKGRSPGVPLGTVLVQMGAISQESLEQAIGEHLLEVVKDIMTWKEGSFHLEFGGGVREDIVLFDGLKTDFLILEAARRQDEGLRGDAAGNVSPKPPKGFEAVEEEIAIGAIPEGPPEIASSSARKDLLLLNSMIEELYAPSSSSEITLLILRYASELMGRAVVFVVREKDIIGLGQFGLGIRSPDEKIKSVSIPLDQPSVFQDAVYKRITHKGPLADGKWHRHFLDQIGGGAPRDVFVAPLIGDGQVTGLLYGDNLPVHKPVGDTEGLEIFIKVAGVAFQKVILERRLSGRGAGALSGGAF
jgi:hypothetical protein